MPRNLQRLDEALIARGLVERPAKAQGLIMAGEVRVNGRVVDKAGTAVGADDVVTVTAAKKFVSRGGYKLDGALDAFKLDVSGRICADVGACTGGFTDVLIQRGAANVYALDVGYGLLDWKLRQDERVVVMERTNVRHVKQLPQPVSFVCADASFISLKLILPAVRGWLTAEADVVALIKPQFEADPDQVGQGGIVRAAAVRRAVVADVLHWAADHGWTVFGCVRSSLAGSGGNLEFLAWLRPGENRPGGVDVDRLVAELPVTAGQK